MEGKVAMLKSIGTLILAMLIVAILMVTVANRKVDDPRNHEIYKFMELAGDKASECYVYMVEENGD
jgi:hypothetical protein